MHDDKLANFIRGAREAFEGEEPPTDLWGSIEQQLPDEDEEVDSLEEFIRINREAFDTATPPPRLAGELFGNAALPSTAPAAAPPGPLRAVFVNRNRMARLLAIAASVAIVFFSAYWIGNRAGYALGKEDAIAAEMRRIDPGAVEAERYYRDEIATQFRRVSQLNDDPQLKRDLADIDQATQELRESLLSVPPAERPRLVGQLIETYQIKLDILLRIEEQISRHSDAPPAPAQRETNHEAI